MEDGVMATMPERAEEVERVREKGRGGRGDYLHHCMKTAALLQRILHLKRERTWKRWKEREERDSPAPGRKTTGHTGTAQPELVVRQLPQSAGPKSLSSTPPPATGHMTVT